MCVIGLVLCIIYKYVDIVTIINMFIFIFNYSFIGKSLDINTYTPTSTYILGVGING